MSLVEDLPSIFYGLVRMVDLPHCIGVLCFVHQYDGFVARFLPLLLVMVPFGVIAHSTGFVADADDCTCW